MTANNILLSDIKLMVQLFAKRPTSVSIFDPASRLVYDCEMQEEQQGALRVLINFAPSISQFKGESLSAFDFVLDFGKSGIKGFEYNKTLRFINNPDGSMRWMFMPGWFKLALAFYNVSGFRAHFFSKLLLLASWLKLERFAANGQVAMHSKQAFNMDAVIAGKYEHYALFMGTPGVQRSVVVALENENKISHFLKIPTTVEGQKLMFNEKLVLNKLSQDHNVEAIIPEVIALENKSVLLTTNVNVDGTGVRSADFGMNHFQFIESLTTNRFFADRIQNMNYWAEAITNIETIKRSSDERLQNIGLALATLKNKIDHVQLVKHAPAHGDFTPWNSFKNPQGLAVYDWEMFQQQAPALFDVFHFVYQRGILMDHVSAKEIRATLDQIFETSHWSEFIVKNHLDVNLFHQLYLLTATSNFARVYCDQSLTLQNEWQLATWTEAINNEVANMGFESVDCRSEFMESFYQELTGVNHAFLKYCYPSLADLPRQSDLDLAIDKSAVADIVSFCENHKMVEKAIVKRKSFMTVIELLFKGNGFLSIDLIHQFKRKNAQMLSAEELLADAIIGSHGLRRPKLKHDLEYVSLFYALNGASIPVKYFDYFSSYSPQETEEAVAYLNAKYDLKMNRLSQLFVDKTAFKANYVKVMNKTSLLKKVSNSFDYLKDIVNDAWNNRGYMITFSGVDGAGKTTIISEVKYQLEANFRKEVVLLRHRPGVLPILSAVKHGSKAKAESIAGTTIPRKGKNQSKISSVLRFGYYYLDYLLGQIYVYVRYVLRGKIVLYDRYYFDFINDAKRSNIEVNRNIATKLYLFVFKPKLNFFLYADAETILKRKQELSASDITELSSNYLSLFKGLSAKSTGSRYVAIKNLHKEVTINRVLADWRKVA
jgi:thymidylate kinase